ncbi:unnamed protein product [Rhodiola kirilowii]
MSRHRLIFASFAFFLLYATAHFRNTEAQSCNPSGSIRGRTPPPGQCNDENDSECCKKGQFYPTYTCSPRVSQRTKATLTLNSFEAGGDGGAESECDNKFHPNTAPVVALSTGWYNRGKRCLDYITIYGNGNSVKAMVVDECDSTMGCDSEHDFQPPCANNIVDASKAVWEALGVDEDGDDWGMMDIYWSDASTKRCQNESVRGEDLSFGGARPSTV